MAMKSLIVLNTRLLYLMPLVENSSLGPQGACPLALVTRFAVPLTLSEQKKVGIRGN